jgi:hypothetical protein
MRRSAGCYLLILHKYYRQICPIDIFDYKSFNSILLHLYNLKILLNITFKIPQIIESINNYSIDFQNELIAIRFL